MATKNKQTNISWTPGQSNVPGIPGVTVQKPTPSPSLNMTPLPKTPVMTPSPTVTKTPTSSSNSGSNSGSTTKTSVVTPTITAPTPVGANAMEDTIATAFDYESQDDPYAKIGEYYRNEMSQEINPQQMYQDKLRQWQGYMDSLKSVYADKYADVDKQTMKNLGTSRAVQARSGLIGSTFGEAQKSKIGEFGLEQKRMLQNEMDAKVQYLMGEIDRDVSNEIAAKRQAIAQGADAYAKYLSESQTRKQGEVQKVSNMLLQSDIENIDDLGVDQLNELAKKMGVPVSELKYSFNVTKAQRDAEALKALQEGAFNLSEGQARYDANGNLIASRAKPGSGSSSSSGGAGVSTQAQTILNLMNTAGGTVDDYVKGTSKESQALRNEIYNALSQQGGVTGKSTDLFKEAKTFIDDMVENKDWKKFGYSAKLGGKLTTGFGDMVARAQTVNSILARDNLGLLKGAMSDKDLSFIQAMSAGVPEGVISEKYAKERIESIQKKINEKVNQFTPKGTQTSNQSINTADDALLSQFGL